MKVALITIDGYNAVAVPMEVADQIRFVKISADWDHRLKEAVYAEKQPNGYMIVAKDFIRSAEHSTEAIEKKRKEKIEKLEQELADLKKDSQ